MKNFDTVNYYLRHTTRNVIFPYIRNVFRYIINDNISEGYAKDIKRYA